MLSSFCLPPVDSCLATSPSQAANERPLRNSAPLPMEATTAVAVKGPTPGMAMRRRQSSSSPAAFAIRCVGLVDLVLQLSQFTPQLCQQYAQQPGQAVIGILQYGWQRSLGVPSSFAEGDAALQQQLADLVDHRCSACDPAIA